MRSSQYGFSLFEMIVVTAITSLIGVWSATSWVQQSEDAASEAMGQWLVSVKASVDQMLVRQGDYLTGISVANESSQQYGDIWHPTVQELIQAGHLASGFSKRPPLGYDISITILKPTGLCLTLGCKLEALTIVKPQSLQSEQAANLSRIGKILASFGGQGASVSQLLPLRVRGPTMDLPNPPVSGSSALPIGSIVLHSFYDSSAQVSFLRQGERRDVHLGADLQVKGRLAAGGSISSQGNIHAAGSIKTDGAFSSGGSMTSGGAISANGPISTKASIHAGGEIVASDRIRSAGHLQLGAVANTGDACEGQGLLAQAQGGGLLICQAGKWQRSAKMWGGHFIIHSGFRCDMFGGLNIDRRNPLTGDCSCPPGYVPQLMAVWRSPHQSDNEFHTFVCLD